LRAELEVLHGIHERMLDDIDRLKDRIRETELEVKTSGESRPPAWVMVQPFGPRDDLQRLEGVDPIVERTLNRLGIRDSWIVDASRLAGIAGN
jgi:hypothetical protein